MNKISVPMAVITVLLAAVLGLCMDLCCRLRTLETDVACIRTKLEFLSTTAVLLRVEPAANNQPFQTGIFSENLIDIDLGPPYLTKCRPDKVGFAEF